jgi:hypothetical protein
MDDAIEVVVTSPEMGERIRAAVGRSLSVSGPSPENRSIHVVEANGTWKITVNASERKISLARRNLTVLPLARILEH